MPLAEDAGRPLSAAAIVAPPAFQSQPPSRPRSAAAGRSKRPVHTQARESTEEAVAEEIQPQTYVPGYAPLTAHMDVASSSALAAAAASGLQHAPTWRERHQQEAVEPRLPPSPKFSFIRAGGVAPHMQTNQFKSREQSPRRVDSPASSRARASPSVSGSHMKSPRALGRMASSISPWGETGDHSTTAALDPSDFSATAAILSSYSGDTPSQQMEVDRVWREKRAVELEQQRSRSASKNSSRATNSRPGSSGGPQPTRSPPPQVHHSNSAEPNVSQPHPASHSRAASQNAPASSRVHHIPTAGGSSHSALPSSHRQHAARASFDVSSEDEVGRLLEQESRRVLRADEVQDDPFPVQKAKSVSSDGMTDRGDGSTSEDDLGEAQDEVPHAAPERDIIEKYEDPDVLVEESKESPQPFPIDTSNMKLSHRLILEQLYGKRDLTSKNPDSSGPSTSGSSSAFASPRHRKLLGLHSGLLHSGSFALGGGVPAVDQARAISVRNQKQVEEQRKRRGKGSQQGKQKEEECEDNVEASKTVYYPGSKADLIPARKRIATLTARSSTPRITQAHNLKRLASGQSVAQPLVKLDDDELSTSTNEWTFLTTLRREQVRQTQIREARIAASRAARVDRLSAKVDWSLEELEARRQQALNDASIPLYQRLGTALPSSKKTRRPPAQSMFHDVALTDGVLSRVQKSTSSQYRMSSNIPGNLTLAAEPKLVAWRLNTNAWLALQQKYISKQVSVAQMSELRILYDALDDDGSDSLDAGEIKTAMRVCGFREEEAKSLGEKLLEWMGKPRGEGLSFAEFSYAVLHYEIPAERYMHGASRAVFGTVQKMQPLYKVMLESNQRSSFTQVVLEFQRHRLYSQAQKATGIELKNP